MRRLRYALKSGLLRPMHRLGDGRVNRRWSALGMRFVIGRYAGRSPNFHDYFLQWLAQDVPQVRRQFELRLLPCRLEDWSRVGVFAAWLQDPAEDWLPKDSFRRIIQLEAECVDRGIPVINPVARLSRAVKSTASQLIALLGVRTPRIWPVDWLRPVLREEVTFPLIIREDRHHGCTSVLVEHPNQLARVNWQKFRHPVAAEFIDVRDPADGLVRKYRFVVAGEWGVPRHLIVSRHWEVRARERIRTSSARSEELAYLTAADPNSRQLQAIRQAMGLHLAAFDYSYDRSGELVVWEANPYPNLTYPIGKEVAYTRPFVERSFAAVAAMYLRAAHLPLPAGIAERLGSFHSEHETAIESFRAADLTTQAVAC
jgi:hypothetical protein